MTVRVRLRADVLRHAALIAGDITYEAMARRTGVGKSTISRLIAGHTAPAAATLLSLCRAYDLTTGQLLDAAQAPEPAVPA